MKIAIIDADLIGRSKHRFPNLACMKLSAYYKAHGNQAELKTDYVNLDQYEKVFISKVFTDTEIPNGIINLPNVEYGGTGFFYDKAPKLPDEVEHIKPDYYLYDEWVNEKLQNGGKRKDYTYYLDYSIGFLTRGCFRQCKFCVNQNYKKCVVHSSVLEFMDESRPKLCFLDDNFFACPSWREIIEQVKATGKKFQFKQGLDERLLTDEKAKELMTQKYDGDYIFAFDNIEDRNVIEEKAHLIRKYNKHLGQNIKFYVLCGFDRNNRYDDAFWEQDIKDTFERIFILAKYNFKPYIMRFEKYKTSPLYGTYVNVACWCNQPSLFNNLSYRQFCEKDDLRKSNGQGLSATWRYFKELLTFSGDFQRYVDVIPKSLVLDYSKW